jgi:superfamily II DNA or RNA helicase
MGVVVLPTAAGKTYLAQLAMQATQRTTLITVPTLDLMHQWYAHLTAAFPDAEIGLLGGGSRDRTPILVATYDSAAIHAETLGNQYALLVFDECHHLPSDFNRVIAEYAIAPYRLGLTATPERSDGKHEDLKILIGQEIYRKNSQELSGTALAKHKSVQIKVHLSAQERERYDRLIQTRNAFLQAANIFLGSVQGWQQFVQASARSKAGRQAMLAHRQARAIAFGTEGKLRILTDLLAQHYPERTLIFTDDNATVYRISQDLLIPAITHQTGVKERHEILTRFKQGDYRTVVASRVLNEGVDVPDASVAIVLSGTGSTREYIQRLGRILRKGKDPDKLALLYEVVAEDTSEENVSRRRRGGKSPTHQGQLELVPYSVAATPMPRAAESASAWDSKESEDGEDFE